ncbi:MAG TPA: hypothetical protein VF020_01210 [Chthoniobacterales bacterium]
MVILSATLYFINHHPGLTVLAASGIGLGVGALLALWRRQALWCMLVISFLFLSSISLFIFPFVNALFLNAFGTGATAIIVHKQETNEMLNESYIWDYDAVLKTIDGRDVALEFSTTSVAIYPVRNEILIPPENDPFIVKYIPGFERNLVIMCDESNYGKRRKIERDRAPVEKAAGQYAVSPTNQAFIKEYRGALQAFLRRHSDDADPDLIQEYEEQLNSLQQRDD